MAVMAVVAALAAVPNTADFAGDRSGGVGLVMVGRMVGRVLGLGAMREERGIWEGGKVGDSGLQGGIHVPE